MKGKNGFEGRACFEGGERFIGEKYPLFVKGGFFDRDFAEFWLKSTACKSPLVSFYEKGNMFMGRKCFEGKGEF